MKALIVIREKEYKWLTEFFPSQHPAMIRICNKHLLEFIVDFAVLTGCTAIRIVVDDPDGIIEKYFQRGELWGVEISYANLMPEESMEVVLKKNSSYCSFSPIFIMDGFFFIHYNKSEDYTAMFEKYNSEQSAISDKPLSTAYQILSCKTGALQYLSATNVSDFNSDSVSASISDSISIPEDSINETISLSSLENLQNLLDINMQIIEKEQSHYVLPGYGTEKGVTIGSNVEINQNTKIIEPVILGSNVRLMDYAVTGPSAVIGSNVIIDTGSHIEQSVIMEGSYVGKHLTIEGKIVDGSSILSPEYGEKLVIEDAFWLSKMQETSSFSPLSLFFNSVAALFLLMIQFIPFIIFYSLLKIQKKWTVTQKSFLINSHGNVKNFYIIKNKNKTISERLFYLLGLDKITFYKAVILGKIKLVGNYMLEDTPVNRDFISDFKEYLPGIYSYSEGEGLETGTYESEIAERFHGVNRSWFNGLKMLIKAIFHRWVVK